MSRHPLVLALAAVITSALLPSAAHAEDLLQTYELARSGDPQFSAAESGRLVTREGSVQARAALLPQITGDASITRPIADGEEETTSRSLGVNARQMVYDHSNFTRLRSANALSQAADFQGNLGRVFQGDDLVGFIAFLRMRDQGAHGQGGDQEGESYHHEISSTSSATPCLNGSWSEGWT